MQVAEENREFQTDMKCKAHMELGCKCVAETSLLSSNPEFCQVRSLDIAVQAKPLSFQCVACRPSQPSHQPQLPRRPMSDQRRRSDDRGMYMGPGMSRPASSDMMHSSSGSLPQRNAETEPAPADAAAPGMVPSLVAPTVSEVTPQPAQEPAPEPDNTASSTENVSILQAHLAEDLEHTLPLSTCLLC